MFMQYQEHGANVPADLLYEMFLQVVPTDLEKELRLEKTVHDVHSAYAYVINDQARRNSDRLARVHQERQKRELSAKAPADFIHAMVNDDNDPVIDKLVAAIENRCPRLLDLPEKMGPLLELDAAQLTQNGAMAPVGTAVPLAIRPRIVGSSSPLRSATGAISLRTMRQPMTRT